MSPCLAVGTGIRDRVCCWQLLPQRSAVTVATLVSSGPSQPHKMLCQWLNLGVPGTPGCTGEGRLQNPRGCDFPLSLWLCLHPALGQECSAQEPAQHIPTTHARLIFVPCQAKWDPEQIPAIFSSFLLPRALRISQMRSSPACQAQGIWQSRYPQCLTSRNCENKKITFTAGIV